MIDLDLDDEDGFALGIATLEEPDPSRNDGEKIIFQLDIKCHDVNFEGIY